MWKTIRVFISSTFMDMREERGWLVREVFPELRKRCAERNLRLVDVDLQWGIPEGKITDETLADICLAEIDSCSPFFVCLLGSRYGTLAKVNKQRQNELNLKEDEYSITELEIYHRLRKMEEKKGGVLFYFRDVPLIEGVPKEAESKEEDKKRLNSLKENIRREVDRDFVVDYSHLYSKDEKTGYMRLNKTEFGKMVLEDLWKQIDQLHPDVKNEQLEKVEQEINTHINYKNYKISQFYGRDNVLQSLEEHIEKRGKRKPVFVTGEAGAGKSSLLSKVIETYEKGDKFVLPVFVGLTAQSSNIKYIVRYISEAIASKFSNIKIPSDNENLHLLFDQLQGEKVTIVIDGLDQVSDKNCKDLHLLLPMHLPEHVQLIISAISESTPMRAIENVFSSEQIFMVEKLENKDIQEMVQQTLKLYSKDIITSQIEALLKNTATSNPLYLKLVLEELRYFVPLKKEVDSEVLKFIMNLPNDLHGMLKMILKRLEQHNDIDILSKTLTLISNSRIGLSEDEVHEILMNINGNLKEPIPEFQWIISSLKNHLLSCSEKQFQTIHVYHQTIREVVNRRYCTNSEKLKQCHKSLADFHLTKFKENHFDSVRSLNEIMYHMMKAECWGEIENLISDFSYLEAQFRNPFIYNFIESLHEVYDYTAAPDSTKRKIEQLLLFVQREINTLQQYPHLILQQAMNQCDVPYLSKAAVEKAKENHADKYIFRLINNHHVNDQISRKLSDSAEVSNVVISQDGNHVSALLTDGTWKMWNVKTGQEEMNRNVSWNNVVKTHAVLFEHQKGIFSTNDGQLNIIDIASGISNFNVCTYDSHEVRLIAVSPNEKYIATLYDNQVIKIWDIHKNKELQHYQLPSTVQSIKFGKSNEFAWLLCEKGEVIKIGTVTHVEMEIKCPQQIVSANKFDFAPDQEEFIYIKDHEVFKWQESSDISLYEDREKKQITTCVTDSNLEKAAFVVHNNIHIWKKGEEKLKPLYNIASGISFIAFIPNTNELLCIQENKVIVLINYEQHNDNSDAVYQKDTIINCAFWDKSRKFSTACKDGTVKIWDLELNTTLKLFKEHENSNIKDLVMAWDKDLFITSAQKDDEFNMTLFDLNNLYKYGREKKSVKINMEEVDVIARINEKNAKYFTISPNGQYLILQDKFGLLSITDLFKVKEESRYYPNKLMLTTQQIVSSSFSSDCSLIAIAFSDKTLSIYNMENSMAEVFQANTDYCIKGLHFLPCNKKLICYNDNEVVSFEINTKTKRLLQYNKQIIDIDTFTSEDGKLSIASMSNNGILKISHDGNESEHQVWKNTYVSKENINPPIKCVFLQEGYILTTSNDQLVKIWSFNSDENKWKLGGEYYVQGKCYSFAWDDTGNLAIADKQGKIHFTRNFNEESRNQAPTYV
ncbi:DUF4062 domain-containing protein [Priestia megaterium]